MKAIHITLFLTLGFIFYACAEQTMYISDNDAYNMNDNQSVVSSKDSISYLALGDSYTIGESVAIAERYPVQIQTSINATDTFDIYLKNPKIIATTGWTTNELKEGIDKANIENQKYDFVSLLIGVNNQYRGYPIDQYIKEFEELLKQAITFASDRSDHVVVISIPDYGVTPFGKRGDPDKIARELDEYNRIAKEIANRHQVDFLNITEISREASDYPNLIAQDQLHPSGLMYKRWVDELIFPWFLEKLVR